MVPPSSSSDHDLARAMPDLDSPTSWCDVGGSSLRWEPCGKRNARPSGSVGDDDAAGTAGRSVQASVASGAKDAAGVVAAPIVAVVRTEEDVPAGASVLAYAQALSFRLAADLGGEQLIEEGRQVDGQAWLPVRAAVRVVLGGRR